jgi:hypothetical protein
MKDTPKRWRRDTQQCVAALRETFMGRFQHAFSQASLLKSAPADAGQRAKR